MTTASMEQQANNRPNRRSLEDRFWSRVLRTDECWLWLGHLSDGGYGRMSVGSKSRNAHRVAWLIHHGDPGALDVLHRCDNRQCVRPDHLFLGTAQDNVDDMIRKGRRGPSCCVINAAKTHCPAGHPYAGANLIMDKRPKGPGARVCRECKNSRRRLKQISRLAKP